MEKPILYYSDKCPDTEAFVSELDALGIAYDTVNITDSMPNLKEFLHLRDTRDEFMNRKVARQVGVPVLLLENETLIFEGGDLVMHDEN